MDDSLFQTLLQNLPPTTLAQLVVDMENAADDWTYYPKEAPAAVVQEKLADLLTLIREVGRDQAKAEGLDFQQLVKQLKAEQDGDDWATRRMEQDVENWLNDFD